MDRSRQAAKVLTALKKTYPDAHCELDFKTPLELVVATILSAQCTDKRVNKVTPALFKKYRGARAYAQANPQELEALIRSVGFYRTKARSIREMARLIVEKFGGRVPDRMEDLLTLRGVARKTASVVLGTAYVKAEGVVVDTHMKRVAYRLSLTDEEDPVKVERDLMRLWPRKDWTLLSHTLIFHGRKVCAARRPGCPRCPVRDLCPSRTD